MDSHALLKTVSSHARDRPSAAGPGWKQGCVRRPWRVSGSRRPDPTCSGSRRQIDVSSLHRPAGPHSRQGAMNTPRTQARMRARTSPHAGLHPARQACLGPVEICSEPVRASSLRKHRRSQVRTATGRSMQAGSFPPKWALAGRLRVSCFPQNGPGACASPLMGENGGVAWSTSVSQWCHDARSQNVTWELPGTRECCHEREP